MMFCWLTLENSSYSGPEGLGGIQSLGTNSMTSVEYRLQEEVDHDCFTTLEGYSTLVKITILLLQPLRHTAREDR